MAVAGRSDPGKMQLPATEVENIVQDVVNSKDNDVDNTLLVILLQKMILTAPIHYI